MPEIRDYHFSFMLAGDGLPGDEAVDLLHRPGGAEFVGWQNSELEVAFEEPNTSAEEAVRAARQRIEHLGYTILRVQWDVEAELLAAMEQIRAVGSREVVERIGDSYEHSGYREYVDRSYEAELADEVLRRLRPPPAEEQPA